VFEDICNRMHEFEEIEYQGKAVEATVNSKEEKLLRPVRHVTGNDQDYLRKIPRVVVQKSALL
jgi:hypothetical protein